MSSINTEHVRREPGEPLVNWLLIASFLPVVMVGAAVLIIAGGFNLSFFIPAIVVGATLGMLMYVSIRDRTTA